jgi:hypothetical protein
MRTPYIPRRTRHQLNPACFSAQILQEIGTLLALSMTMLLIALVTP